MIPTEITHPLLSRKGFIRRLLKHASVSLALLIVSLSIGIIGYHITERLSWTDSVLNASMILAGMGPVDTLHTTQGKWFASFYALFSGTVFIAAAGIVVAPFVHRLVHRLQASLHI